MDLEYSVDVPGVSRVATRASRETPVTVTARVVSTDGVLENRTVTFEFGILKVTSKSVLIRFAPRQRKLGPKSFTREVKLRRKLGDDKSRLDLRRISEHLSFLIAPQDPALFGVKEGLLFSLSILRLLEVAEVMET